MKKEIDATRIRQAKEAMANTLAILQSLFSYSDCQENSNLYNSIALVKEAREYLNQELNQ